MNKGLHTVLATLCIASVVHAVDRRVLVAHTSIVDGFEPVGEHITNQFEKADFEIHQLHHSEMPVGGEPEALEFSLVVQGEELVLEAEPFSDAFHPNYAHHLVSEDGKSTKVVEENSFNCLYAGHIKGSPDESSARLSLCEMIREERVVSGTFRFKGKRFAIQPLRDSDSAPVHHIVYDTSKINSDGTCGNVDSLADENDQNAHFHEVQLSHGLENIFKSGNDFNRLSDERQAEDLHLNHSSSLGPERRVLAQQTKYVGMLIVNDHRRFKDRGKSVHAHTATLINQVQALYDELSAMPSSLYRIQVKVVAMLSFPYEDPWNNALPRDEEGSVLASTLNTAFDEWIADDPAALKDLDMGSDYAVAHLMTGHDLQGYTVGVAYRSGSCRSSGATAVNQATRSSDHLVSTTIAHELAHNLGVRHTVDSIPGSLVSDACVRDDAKYIMDEAGAGESNWSECTPKWMQMHFEGFPLGCKGSDCLVQKKYGANGHSECMETLPRVQWTPAAECGNGVRENGEECDCGQSDCSKIDPCCDGDTCRLKEGAVCSALDPCCDSSQCSMVSASENHVCRPSRGWCDTEEVCNGISPKCPGDAYQLPGTPCQNSFGRGACFVGTCKVYNQQCQALSGKNELPTFSDDGCPSTSPGDEQCGRLLCRPEGSSSCWHFTLGDGTSVSVEDGTPCGARDSKVCSRGSCVEPSEAKLPVSVLCSNGVMDEGETDVDCGGECFPCSNGQGCFSDSDCFSVPENEATCELPNLEPVSTPAPSTLSPTAQATARPTVEIPGGLQCYQLKDKSLSAEKNLEVCEQYPQCVFHNNKCKQFGVPPQGCAKVRAGWKCRRYFDCKYDDDSKTCSDRFSSRRLAGKELSEPAAWWQGGAGRALEGPASPRIVRGVCQSRFAVNPTVEYDFWAEVELWFADLGQLIESNLQFSIPIIIGVAILVFLATYHLADCCCGCCGKAPAAKPTSKTSKGDRRHSRPNNQPTNPASAPPAEATAPRTDSVIVDPSSPRVSASMVEVHPETAHVPSWVQDQVRQDLSRMGIQTSRNNVTRRRCIRCSENYGSAKNQGMCNACASKVKLERHKEQLRRQLAVSQAGAPGAPRGQVASVPVNAQPRPSNVGAVRYSAPAQLGDGIRVGNEPDGIRVGNEPDGIRVGNEPDGIRVGSGPDAAPMGIQVTSSSNVPLAQAVEEDVEAANTTRAILL